MLFQFACPYCGGQFAVDDPAAGHAIACPHCGGQVALPATALPAATPPAATLPTELPPRTVEPAAEAATTPAPRGVVAKETFDPPTADEPIDESDPLVFLNAPGPRTVAVGPRRKRQRVLPPNVRRLSHAEKERRRLRRNLVLMVAGMIVLASVLVALSRF